MSSGLDISYSTVEAFERSKKKKGERSFSHLFMVVLLAVFFIALMAGLIVGVSMYRYAANTQMETGDIRVGTGLLSSYVKANDRADVIGVGEGPEGKSLVMVERLDSGTYELRIYKYEGKIVQEYSVAGTAYTPARAQALVDSSTFDFKTQGNLLTITTDEGIVNVTLRSSQGGA